MSLEISPETESLLNAEAQRRRISVDAFLLQLMQERAVAKY
jgi:predicted HicB family RNase H-like nuclease